MKVKVVERAKGKKRIQFLLTGYMRMTCNFFFNYKRKKKKTFYFGNYEKLLLSRNKLMMGNWMILMYRGAQNEKHIRTLIINKFLWKVRWWNALSYSKNDFFFFLLFYEKLNSNERTSTTLSIFYQKKKTIHVNSERKK